jgi:hypothetical protein
VQAGEDPLDDPAVAAEPRAVLRLAASDHGFDPPPAQRLAMPVGVVAAVAEEAVGAAPWLAEAASHRGHGLHERKQLLDVVAVGAGRRPGERDACRVDQEVLLGAASPM